jgi:hypothetical protein
MAKEKKVSSSRKQAKGGFFQNFDLNSFIPQKFHPLAVILVIIILFLAFLSPMYFGGKTFQSGDIIAIESAKPYIEKEREGFSLWNPYIFCGMPAYSISTEFPWFNLIAVGITAVRSVFSAPFGVDYAKWTFYLILLGITSYLLMRHLTKNTLVSLFTAVTTSLSTGIIVFLFIGHVTKLTSLCIYPLLFLLLLRFQEKIRLIDILILIIALQLFIQGFHVQIIFYTLFAVAIYFIYYFVRSLVIKNQFLRNGLIKSAFIFIGALVVAVLIQADNLTQVYEYTPFSTRGTKSIVEETTGKEEQSTSEYYEYHTNWSFSPEEVLTFIVPSFYGFGNSTYKGPLTNNQEVEVNTYFGQMPFVDVAMYMGVIVFFLALFAIVTRWREPLVQYLSILSFIALLISFGKNFPVLFDLMFYYFPYFDKFRVPSMILVLVQLSFPVLAGLGLMKIISLTKEKDAKLIGILKNTSLVFSAALILSILLNAQLSDWFIGRVNDYAASISQFRPQLAQQFRALADYTAGMFTTDLIIAFVFLSAVSWLAYLNSKGKLSADSFLMILILIAVIDLWRIDGRGARYVDNPQLSNLFNEPDYISVIKAQNDHEPFRIFNLKQDGSLGSFNQNSNFNAYFLVEDFYGYSGIKPRSYQDYMDVVGPANPVLWDMANVKYLIADPQMQIPGLAEIYRSDKTIVYLNDDALPRAYFADTVITRPSIEALNMVKELKVNPRSTAVIHTDELKIDKPDSTAFVKIENYTEASLILDINTSGNNFLFFGNTFISGNADYKIFNIPTGWKAFIDENETKIHRTNHGFMGIVVPEGRHKVVFEYAPESFFISKNISLILSSLVLIGLIAGIFFERKKKSAKVN